MIQYLAFEICKSNNESRYYKLWRESDGYYLEVANGYRGMYIVGNSQFYQCGFEYMEQISNLIEPLKLYAWPKAFPSDYVPEDHLMGCDTNSWSIHYKELEKKYTRHIRGRGEYPLVKPYSVFMERFVNVIPNESLREWLGIL